MNTRSLHLRQVLNFAFAIAVALAILAQASRDHASELGVREVAVPEAVRMIDAGALVIDVRDAAAARASHVPGAVMLSLEALRAGTERLDTAPAREIVVYCGDGSRRGPEATALLNKAGYANAVNLKGGIEGWRAAGRAVTH
jgi:rhodanese-related sulfurtransferase